MKEINTRAKVNLLKLEKEAIAFIKKHEPRDGYFIGFSGEKDSIVVYDLLKHADVKHTAYHKNSSALLHLKI